LQPIEIALVLLSALLHAVWSASIKGSTSPLGFNLLQLAPTFAAGCALPFLIDLREIPREVWMLVGATGLCHGFYFYWLSRCLELGELSVVYPIARSAPAFLPLVAIPLLGETISPMGGAGIAMVVAGMVAIQIDGARTAVPPAPIEAEEPASRVASRRRAARSPSLSSPGVGYAWLTLAASVGYSITDKAAMTRLGVAEWSSALPPVIAYYILLCVSGGLVFTPLALRRISPRQLVDLARTELRPAMVASIVSFASYGLILQALATAPVSYVVATRQSSVLFAIAIGAVRWRETPSRLRILGALATVAGVALVARSRA
jgi:uncharacterized membrane protein